MMREIEPRSLIIEVIAIPENKTKCELMLTRRATASV